MNDSYPVHFFKTGTGYCAYVPELDGVVATGSTLEATRDLMAGALAMHLDAMRRDGDDIPEPADVVEIVAADREMIGVVRE